MKKTALHSLPLANAKILLTLIIAVLACQFIPKPATAQPTLTNIGNFVVGSTFKYQKCSPNSASTAATGANSTWNYSGLTLLADTLTENILAAGAAPHASLFPAANLAEEFSDGTYVYLNKTQADNNMAGIATPLVFVFYPNPALVLRRPASFGAAYTDVFTDTIATANSSGFHFRGAGTIATTCDGYGTLILPNGTYNNVLRIKTVQRQVDTLLEFGTVDTTFTVVYTWYDGQHTTSLLRIDSTGNSTFADRNVSFLLSETIPTGLYETQASSDMPFSAAMTGSSLLLSGDFGKTPHLNASVSDVNGKLIMRQRCAGSRSGSVSLPLPADVPAQLYVITLTGFDAEGRPTHYGTRKVMKQR